MAYDLDHTWSEIMNRVTIAARNYLQWKSESAELFEDLRVYSTQFADNAAIATHLDGKEAVAGTVTTAHIDDLETALTSMRDIGRLSDGTTVTLKAFTDDLRKFVP